MNKKFSKKTLFLFLGIALIYFSLQANAAVSLASDYTYYEVNKSDTQVISLKLSNTETSEREVVLEALTNNQMLKAYLPASTLTVSANSSTSISLQLFASSSIPSGSYTVTVNAYYADGQASRTFYVRVGSSTENLNLSLTNNIACINENSLMKLQLKNDNSYSKTVILGIESELFLPTLSPSYVTLDANKIAFIDLMLHANDSVKEGTYSLPVLLQTSSKLTRKEISVKLIDCTKNPLPTIEFWANESCSQLSKDSNQISFISFNVSNKSDREQTIDLDVESSLNISLSETHVTLAGSQTKPESMAITLSNATESGLKSIRLIALKNNQRIAEYDINCLAIKPKYSTAIDSSSLQGSEISVGTSQSFEILVSNNGDEIEDYALSVEENISGLTASFSSSRLSVPAKESKSVMLSINPTVNASGGAKTITLKANGKSTASQQASFTVLTSITKPGQIEVVSWPAELSVSSGQEMTVLIKVKNTQSNELNDLIVSLSGAESFLQVSQPVKQMHLASNEERTISILLKAKENLGEEEVNLTLQAESQGIEVEKTVKLLVNKPLSSTTAGLSIPEEFKTTPSGFVSLGSLGSLGLLLAVIIIVVAFLYYRKQKPENIAAIKEAIKKALKLN